MIYQIIFRLVRLYFFVMYRIRYHGKENLPSGAAVVCANHTSATDPLFVVFMFTPYEKWAFMAKQELLDVPVLGSILRTVGVFGVQRGGADIKAIKHALGVLKKGEKLLMFPEGTRVAQGEQGDAKTGAVMLAIRAGAPIVPVYVTAGRKKIFRRVDVCIGTPYSIVTQGKPTPDDYRREADRVMNVICGLAPS